jgi:hypothetical protein
MDTLELAEKALEMPSDFFTSDENIGTTHALTISVHRDSETLDQSNWEVIKDDMVKRFPDDVYVHGATHWAVGWCDQLAVRVYLWNPKVGRVISPAFLAILEWKDALENYPIADESHYSEMEYNDAIETLENYYGVSKEQSTAVFSELFDSFSVSRSDEFNEDIVAEAIYNIGADCQECGDNKARKLRVKQLQYGTMKQALCLDCYFS